MHTGVCQKLLSGGGRARIRAGAHHCPVSHHFSKLIDLDSYAGQVHSDVFWHFRSTARAAAVEASIAGIGDLPPERRDLRNVVVRPNFMANIYPGVGSI